MEGFLEKAKIQDIQYVKNDNELIRRRVIPTQVPSDLVTTVDVTKLSESEQVQMLNHINDYTAYVDGVLATIFTLEDFIEHATNETPDIKWRRFYKSNIELCGED